MQICNPSSSSLSRVKPQDLRIPYCFADRYPVLLQGVFFLPDHYYEHEKYGLESWYPFYKHYKKIYIEYCSGNGTWILEKAKQDPSILWIAVERRWDRARKIWVKKENYKIDNCLIVYGNAEAFSQYYLQKGLINAIFVNFPDPWPKEKHAKNRLFQAPFIGSLNESLKPCCAISVVTDDPVFKTQIVDQFALSDAWINPHLPRGYLDELDGYGSSFFEELWRSKGLGIHYMQFFKKEGAQ